MQIVIVAGGLGISGYARLGRVAAILAARGYDVVMPEDDRTIGTPPFPASFEVRKVCAEFPAFPMDLRREREYPTLREGLRNPRIRKTRGV